jgi:hypothetical protein
MRIQGRRQSPSILRGELLSPHSRPARNGFDEGALGWCEDRPHVMNEQPCDHEENGTRAWKIVWVRVRAPYKTFRLDMKRRSINFFETPLLPVPAYLADATNTGNRRLQRIVCSVVVPDDHSRPQVAGIAIYENH